MKKRFKTAGIAFIAAAVAALTVAASADDFFKVSRVIDGDTIKLEDGRRVRLIGLDTPESKYNKKLRRDASKTGRDAYAIQRMGEESARFTKRLCEGKRVRLVSDVERFDRYGRTLAYVYLEDGTFVNARIIEEGYGQVMTIPPNVRYAGYFRDLMRKARAEGKGLWREGEI